LVSSLCYARAVPSDPNYKRPAVPAPPEYRGLAPDRTGKAELTSFGEQKWWDAFQDEALSDLIRTALKQNYDVQIAAARILEARAQLGITRADQLPSVDAGATAVNERIPRTARIPSIETSINQVSVSLAWELDFWGKFRRATESARANLLSQEWARHEVIRSLVGDVASAYFQLRELDLELEISRQTLASRKDSLRLTQILADGGATSMLDVRQAEQYSMTTLQSRGSRDQGGIGRRFRALSNKSAAFSCARSGTTCCREGFLVHFADLLQRVQGEKCDMGTGAIANNANIGITAIFGQQYNLAFLPIGCSHPVTDLECCFRHVFKLRDIFAGLKRRECHSALGGKDWLPVRTALDVPALL